MRYHVDEHNEFMRRVMQSWQSIYRMAYAATGTRELAEVVLQESLLDVYMRESEGSMRENFRRSITECAQEHRRKLKRGDTVNADWDGFREAPSGLSASDMRLWSALAEQPTHVKRIIVLKHALKWSDKQIADCLGMRKSDVKSQYAATMAQLTRRYIPPQKAGVAK